MAKDIKPLLRQSARHSKVVSYAVSASTHEGIKNVMYVYDVLATVTIARLLIAYTVSKNM